MRSWWNRRNVSVSNPFWRIRMRHRAIAAAICIVVAVGVPAAYFIPLVIQYAEGQSAEAAVAHVNASDVAIVNGYEFSLEREYVDAEGRTVYRLVSDTQPSIVWELRYGFRWFPEPYTQLQLIVVTLEFHPPGPFYETVNDDEYLQTLREWQEAKERLREDSL